MDRHLKQLGEGWKAYSDDRGSGYEIVFPHGKLRLIRSATIPGCENSRGWVAMNYNPDGTPSHGNEYPSFRQALAAVRAD